jgi:4-hydroxy-tetrahydrodipicolinate reductase
VPINADLDAALAGVDCLIDFTRPEGTLQHLASCRKHGVAMVIGTTGFIRRGARLQIRMARATSPSSSRRTWRWA